MAEKTRIDFSQKTCGALPEMLAALEAAPTDVVELKVRASIVPQAVSTLASGGAWGLDIEEQGERAVLRFTRRGKDEDNPLELV